MDIKLPTYEDLVLCVNELNANYFRPDVAIELQNKRFDLTINYNELKDWYKGKTGVYILFNEQEEIIRIGLSINDLYERLDAYFNYLDDDCKVGTGWWKEGVSSRYIMSIVIPKSHNFITVAVERYLIDKLTPPLNDEGKEKHYQYRKKMLVKLDKLSKLYGWPKIKKEWYTDSNDKK